jgi:small subunit ribosomal protein S9
VSEDEKPTSDDAAAGEQPKEPESTPDDKAAAQQPEQELQGEGTRAAPSSEPDSEQPEPEAPAEPVAAAEPEPEAPAEPQAAAEPEPEPATSEPEPEPEPPVEAPEPEPEPAAEVPEPEPPAEPAQPEATAEPVAATPEPEEFEPTPREKPEIPGADLVPDIIPDAEEFLDAEALAAAEAEAEAAAAQDDQDEPETQPIADAAIDLAAGARYTATGKRKTAVARVILKPGTGTYLINEKPLDAFFPRETLRRIIRQPLEAVGYDSRMDVIARMHGGGVAAQAGALRHGISRALIVADPHLRGELKRRGFLTRDPRVKERKKAGLKKARKRPQFSKR